MYDGVCRYLEVAVGRKKCASRTISSTLSQQHEHVSLDEQGAQCTRQASVSALGVEVASGMPSGVFHDRITISARTSQELSSRFKDITLLDYLGGESVTEAIRGQYRVESRDGGY